MIKQILPVIFAIALSTGCTSSRGYVQRGDKLLEAGKYEQASLSYRNAIKKDRNSGEAYYKLGLSELRQNEIALAYSPLISAVTLLPNNTDAKIALANVCVQAYRSDPRRPKALYDELVKMVDQLSAVNPNAYDTWRLRGYLAVIDRRVKDEVAYFDAANKVRPFQPEVIFNLMQALIEDQQVAKAEALGQEMILRDKTYGPVYDLLYANAIDRRQAQQAEEILKLKVRNNPDNSEYALQLAAHYVRSQKPSEVPPIINRLLQRASAHPGIYLQIASFYTAQGNWDDAASLLERGAAQNPKDKIAFEKRLTTILLAQGKKQEASRLADAILRESPKDNDTRRLQAVMLLDTLKPENLDKALTALQALIQESPLDVALRFNLATTYIAKEDWNSARKELSEILRQSPEMLQAHLALAEIAYKLRQPDQVIAQVTPVLAARPENSRARFLRAVAMMGAGNATAARNELTRLIRDDPKNTDAQIELGYFDLAEKKNQQAEATFRKFYQPGRTNSEALQGLVTVLSVQGRFEEAFHVAEEEVKNSRTPGALRLMLAKAAAQTGKDDVALAQLQESTRDNPKSFDAYFLLGQFYIKKANLEQARGALEKARSLNSSDVRPYILIAALQDKAGERPQAIDTYRRALSLRPDDATLLNDVAYYFAENGGNLDEALEMSRRAVEKLKGADYASDTLAWIYLKKNMTNPALQILNTLVRKNPNAALFRYHLGVALAAKGDRDGAKAELTTALTKKPAKQDEAKIKELLARLG